MLLLIATPIGHLKDISLRALEELKGCDLILCEDTRHSAILLKEYDVHKPLKSFHKFNEKIREDWVVEQLKNGKRIAVITDAGTPGICDPGESLVRRCRKEQLPIMAIPGACAWVVALTLSPLKKDRVQFCSYLPKKEQELRKELSLLMGYQGTSVCYETPHRIIKTLEKIEKIDGQRRLCILRELTKVFEEYLEGTPLSLQEHFQLHPPRGEMVLLIEGIAPNFQDRSEEELIGELQEKYSLSLAEAIKTAAELTHLPRKVFYRKIHQGEQER